jgi:hypothetical protein
MATRTYVLRRFNDPVNPAIEGRLEFDWNDTNNRITAVRCINPTSQAFFAKATPLVDPAASMQKTYPANSGTTVDSVPGVVASKYGVTITNGKLDGVIVDSVYPA